MAERACSLSGLANVVRTLWAKSSADGADTPLRAARMRSATLLAIGYLGGVNMLEKH